MKIKVMKITYHAQIGYSVFYRTWYWPFWRQFLYGINEGGGQYFIFENTKQKALEAYREVIKISDITDLNMMERGE